MTEEMMSFSFEDVRRVDGDLADALARLEPSDAPQFEGVTVAEGEWVPPRPGPALGYLVVAGFVARRVELAGGVCIELFGPGELLRTDNGGGRDSFDMVPAEVTWTVLSPLALALLDESFGDRAGRDPELQRMLLAHDGRRSDALALRFALTQLPRVSSRLHFLLWQLAERYGSPGRSGVLMPLQLSHGLLAEMVAGEPTEVKRALRELGEQGVIAQAPRGLWLNGAPPGAMASGLTPELTNA